METTASQAYPSMKPLSAWVTDVMQRIDFIRGWIDKGVPAVFWISGLYFPQVRPSAHLRLRSLEKAPISWRFAGTVVSDTT